jgi:hypothetical protein
MDEATWLAATDPQPMLDFLRHRVSDRKLRLFSCGCVRRVWGLLLDGRGRNAVVAAERFADGLVTTADLTQALDAVCVFVAADAEAAWNQLEYALKAAITAANPRLLRVYTAALLVCPCTLPKRRPTTPS